MDLAWDLEVLWVWAQEDLEALWEVQEVQWGWAPEDRWDLGDPWDQADRWEDP